LARSPKKKSCALFVAIAKRSVCRISPLPPKTKKRKRRVVVDTSVLVAGISGFRETYLLGKNPSADVLDERAEEHNLTWLISEEIRDEYKEVLRRLRVRSHLIGRLVNLIRDRAEDVKVRYSIEISPTRGAIHSAFAPSRAMPTSS
jgi:hypothetical protein